MVRDQLEAIEIRDLTNESSEALDTLMKILNT